MRALAHLQSLPLVGSAIARLEEMRIQRIVAGAVASMPAEHLRIAGVDVPIYGVDVIEGEAFVSRARATDSITHAVVHESVTRTGAATERVLRRKGYGVALMLEPDGTVTQHNDCAERTIHAGGLNGPGVGIEIVNPYYPEYLKTGSPWRRIIPARWAHKGRYVVPTRAQLEALVAVLRCLFEASDRGLIRIPRAWPGLDGHGRMSMGRIDSPRSRAGVQGHVYSGHADGGFPVLYAYLRIEREMEPAAAYAMAIDLASGAGRQVRLPEAD